MKIKRKIIRWIHLWLMSAFLISACAQAPEGVPTTTPGASVPAAGFRVLDLSGNSHTGLRVLDLAAGVPTATATPFVLPTPTPLPPTPTPADIASVSTDGTQPTATIETSPTPSCTNIAEFVKDISLPANVAIHSEQSYGKIWQIKNVGTCTWTTRYALQFAGGDPLKSPEVVYLQQEVKPGETIDLKITIIGPINANTYNSYWMLQDEMGNRFGVGTGQEPLVITVVVPKVIKPCPV